MISFVWSSIFPIMAGTGGSENYTLGQIRELQSRGIDTRIITVGFGKKDNREDFPDIEFFDVDTMEDLSKLDDTLISVSEPLDVKTKNQSYTILHCPPGDVRLSRKFASKNRCSAPIVTSHHAALVWSKALDIPAGDIPVVYPFAQDVFSRTESVPKSDKTRVLFAGRLTPDKGVYTLLWALESDKISLDEFQFTMTDAGKHHPHSKNVYPVVQAHPYINLIEARKSPEEMAELLANTDVLAMPSSALWWDEMFGIISIEAQHAGVRVVASDAGGIPETDCGGLLLVEPDNPKAFEEGLLQAAKLGRLSDKQRKNATEKFTLRESVDKLLTVINYQD